MADILPDFTDKARLLAHAALSVGTSAVIVKAGVTPAPGRESVLIYNDSNNTIFFGLASVTATGTNKGLPIGKQSYVLVPADEVNHVYLISATGTNTALVFEFGDK